MQHEKTRTILKWFEQINQIPRPSKHEEAIAKWLMNWAEEHSFSARMDEALNIVIDVPGTPGYERSPTVVIQGHMDMVCEKTKDSTHDFSKDPIRLVYDGDWLKADRTTLGADNGIALAMALTVATAGDVPHPPLELLFTVDEETGLTGANALQGDFIQGKLLLNLDSEDEGVFTVGCAGGRDTHVTLPIEIETAPESHRPYRIIVEGFKGGHSGVDIHEQRGNAVRSLAQAVFATQKLADTRLVSLQGGTAHNAIPRDAEAVLFIDSENIEIVAGTLSEFERKLKSELAKTDPNAALLFRPEPEADRNAAWSADSTARAIDLLLGLPHGVDTYSLDIDGLVETSNNLASVRTVDQTIVLNTSQRSSVMNRLDQLTDKIEAVSRMAGADPSSEGGYPSWEPNLDSALLARCRALYQELFNKPPVVEIIHAGLECGIIGSKYAGMDMISFGPTIKNPHSPDELIEIPSIGLVWDFLAALLKSLK